MTVNGGPLFGTIDDILWWISQPTEMQQRASLAIELDGARYAVEPVDCAGLDDRLAEHGGIEGVLVLMDRHSRDARKIAARHDVPVYAPVGADQIADSIGGPIASFDAGESFELRWLHEGRFQEELALFRPDDETLFVPETLGRAPYFTATAERIGIHPMARIRPPRAKLSGLSVARLFFGHGRPIADVADREIDHTLQMAGRRLPSAMYNGFRAWLPW